MTINEAKVIVKRKYNHTLNFMASHITHIEKKIAFESFNGRQYSDNPRAISERMHELYPDYCLVWGIQSDTTKAASLNIPEYVKVYPMESWEYKLQRASAFALVRNEAMPGYYYKRKGQVFIQTWHGDRGIKRIQYDAHEASDKTFSNADSKLTDLFVVGSDYAERRIKTAFRYMGKTIKTGCPRNDCLIYPRNTDVVLKKIGIEKGKKILLYAPTLRNNSKFVHAAIDINETLQHLNTRGKEWVCLVRAHPKSLGVDVGANSNTIDVSKYPDMADLLMVADFLITDYSSCAGDFVLRKKPLVLAQFDLEQFMDEDRTFYVDTNEIGYLIARTQEELNHYIDTMTDNQFVENCEKVLSYFGTCETGHAAEDVCRWINACYCSQIRK